MATIGNHISCPECGAPTTLRSTTISLVCEYCDSTIVRTDDDVKLFGKVSALIDSGSPILLHSRGSHEGQPFEIVGRLQLGYARGTWSEWHLEFSDGTTAWLADAQGQYSITFAKPPQSVPRFDDLGSGQLIDLNGRSFLLTDKRAATYQGAEGELPFVATQNQTFYAADFRNEHGEFATLDYGSDSANKSPLLYLGRAVDLRELNLNPLRKFEGW